MRIYAILSLAILLLGLAPGSMLAQPAPSPATVSASQQLDFTSAVNGKTYRIQVALPYAPPPKGGFRTLYVLDGGAYFASFADAARLRNALGQELQPAIIVAISYPGPIAVAINRRLYDLTPTAPPGAEREARAKQSQGGTPNEYAGADTFLKIIETEIKPKIAAIAPVAKGQDILFGHSLGGLFVLHTLFTHPETFQTYLALSPSIWWNDKVVLKDEKAFAARVSAGEIAPQVFIGVGGLEQTPPARLPAGQTPEQAADEVAASRMVSNAKELAGRLSGLKGGAGYRIGSRVFANQSHISVPWAALNPVLDFALGLDRR